MKKFKVTVDHYGANRDVPLYTKSYKVDAEHEQGAVDSVKKFFGGRNHRVEQVKESFSFKDYLNEESARKGGLHVFDIDETLFKTTAKIHVKDSQGKKVKELSNAEFNDHKLAPGHQYGFDEFRQAKKFHDESEPIHPMIAKLRKIHANVMRTPGSRVIMNTARADFDDRDTFLSKFKKHGIDIDNIHVHRAGNIEGDHPPAEKKNVILRKHLDSGQYRHATMYDDSTKNLHHFLQLKHEYPDMEFHAYHVKHDGSIKKFKP